MRGEKENPYPFSWNIKKDWSWSNPKYTFTIPEKRENISLITIDPSFYMADIDRKKQHLF